MTYAVPGPPTKQRPAPVKVAVVLLWAVAAMSLLSIALTFVPTPELDQAMEEFARENPQFATDDSLTLASSLISALVIGVIGIAFAILAVFVNKGSQPARVITWVLGGIMVLCQGCGLIFAAATPALMEGLAGSGDADTEAVAEQARIITENTPAWLTAASTAIGVLSVIALILVIILLAVPSANEYFRKQDDVWVPPTGQGGGGFPQYPPPAVPQDPGSPPPPPAAPPSTPPPPAQQ